MAITNPEFARRVGCHFTMASRLLNGHRLPGIDLMERISAEFEIPIEDLLAARRDGAAAMAALLRERCHTAPETSAVPC